MGYTNEELTKKYSYHYTYMITNNSPIDHRKFYIGVRSCNGNPFDDEYMGSSNSLKSHMKVQGKDNFTKKIINIYRDRDSAAQHERALFKKFGCGLNKIFYNETKDGKTFSNSNVGKMRKTINNLHNHGRF